MIKEKGQIIEMEEVNNEDKIYTNCYQLFWCFWEQKIDQ